jgi:hypothetical protein
MNPHQIHDAKVASSVEVGPVEEMALARFIKANNLNSTPEDLASFYFAMALLWPGDLSRRLEAFIGYCTAEGVTPNVTTLRAMLATKLKARRAS